MRLSAYILSILACFGLFLLMMKVKGDVTVLLRERQTAAKEQIQLQEDLRVLKAEYAYLTHLPKLEKWAKQFNLVPVKASQLQREVF